MEYCAKVIGTSTANLIPVFAKYSTSFQEGKMKDFSLWENIYKDLNIKNKAPVSLWKKAVCHSFIDKTETFELLKLLKGKGYITGFISNTEMSAVEYFFEKKMDLLFDTCIFSCVEGVVKPNNKIYRIALNKSNLQPSQALMIDDKIENIEAAKQIGMNGIVFENIEQVKNELSKKLN